MYSVSSVKVTESGRVSRTLVQIFLFLFSFSCAGGGKDFFFSSDGENVSRRGNREDKMYLAVETALSDKFFFGREKYERDLDGVHIGGKLLLLLL